MKQHSRILFTAFAALAVIFAAGGFWACRAQGDSSTGVNGSFTTLELDMGVSVTYVQGPYKPVQITGNKNKVDYVTVKRNGSTLYIGYKATNGNRNINTSDVKITVQAPDVHEFALGVGSSLSVPKGIVLRRDVEFDISTGASANVASISANDIDVDCSTGASVKMRGIQAAKVNLDCSTGAEATLSGRTGYLEVDCSTGSIVNAFELRADRGEVDAGTGAQVKVNIKNLLSCEKGVGAEVTNKPH